MILDLHVLRPIWALGLIPWVGLWILLWRQTPKLQAWEQICDKPLLDHLQQKKTKTSFKQSLFCLLLSLFFMILALCGPAWYKLPTATYRPIQARVLVLDMSENMMQTDLSPNRLSRAKFKLQDLFARKGIGQFGLVVFTAEPFVVSPLTEDGQTINALLTALNPDIMPVSGHNLEAALQEARLLIQSSGFKQGQILVLTANSPSTDSILLAKKLASEGLSLSIMPMTAEQDLHPLFKRFAQAGEGQLIPYSADSKGLDRWIKLGQTHQFVLNKQDDIPLWKDEGRWFLIPALIFLLPVFRRGWLQRIAV